MAYDNTNTGILFAETKKTNPNAPDFRGNIELGADLIAYLVAQHKAGQTAKIEIAGWKKRGAKSTFLSLKLQQPRAAQGQQAAPARQAQQPEPQHRQAFDLDDEIPF